MGQLRLKLAIVLLVCIGVDPFIGHSNSEPNSQQKFKAHCTSSTFKRPVLTLCGPINAQSVSRLERALSQGVEKIKVSSLGGSERSALRIARLIHKNEIEVEVFDRCYSACAHIILMLVANVSVQDDTEIGFHRTPFANLNVAGGIDEGDFNARVSLNAMRAMSRMTALQFRGAGVDPAILSVALSETQPSCVSSFTVGGTKNAYVTNIEYRSTFKFWIPDRATINSYRTSNIGGWWPKTHGEAANQLARTRTKVQASQLAFGAPSERSVSRDIFKPC